MIHASTPQAAGIPQARIDRFLGRVQKAQFNFHSLLMLKGDQLFYEAYADPFDAHTPHRMYSVTKSFVSVAIGCLIDEGRLSLDDRIVDFFPDKLPEKVPELLKRQTIRDMLEMRTVFAHGNWFTPDVTDRTRWYFSLEPDKPSGTLFHYDSSGSYILGVLVERLSGMALLDYLKLKVLDTLGGFENAQILETPDGTPWGDSALVCTPRALLNFAKFVMDLGRWEGRQLVSAEYMKAATTKRTDNDLLCVGGHNVHGYGYQIWMNEHSGFSFHGMGGQFAVCVPEADLIVVTTGDNQMDPSVPHNALFDAVYDELVGCPLPVEPVSALSIAHGGTESRMMRDVSGREFICEENPMGITRFSLTFKGDEGVFDYTNAQGRKQIAFGLKRNVIGPFPQAGYSDGRGNVHIPNDFRYRCAASAGWLQENIFQLRVQIIDRYLAPLVVTFGFTPDGWAGVRMCKVAEDFLNEYEGWMIAKHSPNHH